MGKVMTWKHQQRKLQWLNKWTASQQYMGVPGEVLDQAEGGKAWLTREADTGNSASPSSYHAKPGRLEQKTDL